MPYLIQNDIRSVIVAVARHFSLHVSRLTDSGRSTATVSTARHVAAWIARYDLFPQPSLPEIGRAFNRDHSTILNSIKRVAADRELQRLVQEVVGTLHRFDRCVEIDGGPTCVGRGETRCAA